MLAGAVGDLQAALSGFVAVEQQNAVGSYPAPYHSACQRVFAHTVLAAASFDAAACCSFVVGIVDYA